MTNNMFSRRLALKQLVSLSALGALGLMRAPSSIAGTNKRPAKLIPSVEGKVIGRKDSHYELWRQSMVWHASKPNRYPEMIVQAQSEADVIKAVKFAADNKLKVAIRSGGHNSTGSSLRDGSLLIDLSALDNLYIDTAAQVAYVEPGVRSLQLVTAARGKGLSFPVPHCASVGISGFVMGGGIGWNYAQRGGVATFSIVGAEIITAQGKRLLATADQNADLYWAVRGSGPGFFGVVTRLHLQLYPVPQAIMASSYIFSLDDLKAATEALDAIKADKTIAERVEVIGLLMHNPEAPPEAPPEKSKIFFVTAFAFEDSVADAKAVLAPFAKLSTQSLVAMENQSFTFEQLYDRFFSLEDPGGRMARYAVDNILTDKGSQTLLALADHFRQAPSRDSHVLASWGMKLERKDDACFSGLGDCFIGCYSIWDREEDDQRNYAWLRQTPTLMDPFADGHYVNEVDGQGNADRYRQCYSEGNWKRLQQLRKQYDPQGVFHSYLGHS